MGNAMDDIVAQGRARLSPRTMADLRLAVARAEPPSFEPPPSPLYGIALIVDRHMPDGFLMPDRPSIDAPGLSLGRFIDEWTRINGRTPPSERRDGA